MKSHSPIFEGSFLEFQGYIGAECKNAVNSFCKATRRSHKGICENCREKFKHLDSAHIVDRKTMIKDILDKHFKTDIKDRYRVDLERFFDLFKQAHKPIKDHIVFLCKECHDKFHNKEITIEEIRMKQSENN